MMIDLAALLVAVELERGEGRVSVRIDGEPFTEFVYADLAKPVLHPILGPHGERVTRGYPMDPQPDEADDHRHHTSQWFAHGDVNGADFWTGRKNARITIVGEPELSAETGTITASFQWRKGDERVCDERRTMRFEGDGTTRIIDFDIELTASYGPVTFSDTKEGTFALRLAPTLRLTGPVARGTCHNSAGDRNDECWGKRSSWVEYAGPIGDRQIGVAIFDHPENPRHPTRWHARAYGLFAANPFGDKAFAGKPAVEVTVPEGESIRFRYRILVHADAWSAEQLADAWEAWVRASQPGAPGSSPPGARERPPTAGVPACR